MQSKTSLLKSVILVYILMCIVLFVKDAFAENERAIETENISVFSPRYPSEIRSRKNL